MGSGKKHRRLFARAGERASRRRRRASLSVRFCSSGKNATVFVIISHGHHWSSIIVIIIYIGKEIINNYGKRKIHLGQTRQTETLHDMTGLYIIIHHP
jgi:hypothetical protein